MTKNQQGMLANYNHATKTSIAQAYKKASYAKQRAEYLILQDMKKLQGDDYRVCGYSCMHFTAAFTYTKDNSKHLRYYTAYNTYDFIIREVK